MHAEPLRLTISSRSGQIRVTAAVGSELAVKGGSAVTHGNGSVTIEPDQPSARIEVTCPAHADVAIGAGSGHVDLRGPLGAVRVVTNSGSVTVERAESSDIRSGSAGVRIGRCAAECRVVTKSGGVGIERAGSADISTQSGKIEIDDVAAANLRSVTGSIKIGLAPAGRLRICSVSSSVTITVPRGMRPARALHSKSGSIRDHCQDGNDGSIDVFTESGSIRVSER